MYKKLEEVTLETLYASGELSVKQIKDVKMKFKLTCTHCDSSDIALMNEMDDDGYCDTCSSPYALFTIKCKACGQGISIRT